MGGVCSRRPALIRGFVLAGAALSILVGASPAHEQTRAAVGPAPTFGRPTIVGLQAGGNSEPFLGIDTHGRRYVTVPYGSRSLLWRSTDEGRTFKWVPGAEAKTGSLPTCPNDAGGDAELATDAADRLYFSDRFHAFSSPYNTAARSDDQGATFTFSCDVTNGAPSDRPWLAVDGDPLKGGSVYLALTLVGSDRTCEPGVARDTLALARSPLPGKEARAGVIFSPLQRVNRSCGMEFAGTGVQVSPATHHVLVLYAAPRADGDSLRLVRCATVAFSPANPAGLSCIDLPVTTAPDVAFREESLAVDSAGNLYAVWSQFPFLGGKDTGDSILFWSSSKDEGVTWSDPIQIPTPGLHNNIQPWAAAGDAGRVDVAWYGTKTVDRDPNSGCGGAADADGQWSVYLAETLNGLDRTPAFTQPIVASEHFVHRGGISGAPGGKFCGNSVMGDFLQLRIGPDGEANIVYADSNNSAGLAIAHPIFVRQNGGIGLRADRPMVAGALPARNGVQDPAGDATYDVGGNVSRNQPNLDILHSSISKPNARRYRITITVADLRSLRPDPSTGNPDRDLVWLVQWLVPSSSDPNGGKDFFAYMESTNGRRPRYWVGETTAGAAASTFGFAYAGAHRVRGAYTATAPGTIAIDAPVASVREARPINRTLYQVTTSTMTFAAPSTSGRLLFNVIDVAPSFDFVPTRR
jgi:hypothetical protein